MQALTIAIVETGVKFQKNPVDQLENPPSGLESFQLAFSNFSDQFGMADFPADVINDIKDRFSYAMPVAQAGMLCFVSRDGRDLTIYDTSGQVIPFS